MFDPAIFDNAFFRDQTLSIDGPGPVRTAEGREVPVGAFPRENGDVFLRLHIRGAKTVRVCAAVSNSVSAEVDLADMGGDFFEGILPFDRRLTGPANLRVTVNGAEVVVPDLPVIWTDNRPQNNLEIPDPEGDYLLHQDVPHGSFIRETIFAQGTGREERCMVYAPSDWRTETEPLPMLYLLHGGTDNELMWEYVGKLSAILDNLWAAGKAKRFYTVMCNGMLRRDGVARMPVDKAFEETLLTSVIPFIEGNYRVCTDREHRAIAGLSMGAYMSCDIGFAHPELFASIGTFTASMTSEGAMMSYERPYPQVLADGAEAFGKKYRLYFRSTTPQENHPEFFEADDRLLAAAGIDQLPCHHRILYPPHTSKWNSWRMGLRDFAQLVFQD